LCADAAALAGDNERSDEFVRALAGLVCVGQIDPRARRARRRQLLIAGAARSNGVSLVLRR
jgi:hypothetical protein